MHAGWGSQVQSSMRPLLRVVTHVDTEHPIEMPTLADEDVVEALRAHGPHEPLRKGEAVMMEAAGRIGARTGKLG